MATDLIPRPALADVAWRRRFGELTARSWCDDDLRDRYERDPHTVLAEFGVHLPLGAPVPPIPELADDLVVEPLKGGGAPARPCACSLTLPCFASPQADELS